MTNRNTVRAIVTGHNAAPRDATVAKSGETAAYKVFASGAAFGPSVELKEPVDPFTASLWVYKCICKTQSAVKGVPVRLSRKETLKSVRQRSFTGGPHASRLGLRNVRGTRRVMVGRAAEGDIIEAGPAAELLEKPNGYQRWTELIEAVVGCLKRTGAVAIVKQFAPGQGRTLLAVHAIDGRRVKPHLVVDDSGLPSLLGYEYTPPNGARVIPLTVDEVVYLYNWHPEAALRGLAPAAPGRLSIATDYSASLFNAAALANGGMPGAFVRMAGELTPEQRSEMAASWRSKYGGPENALKVAFLQGAEEVGSIASTFAELQFQEGKKTTRLELCALYDVPPFVAGWMESAGDSSAYADAAKRMFWEDAVFPLLDVLGSAFQVVIDAVDPTLELWFDVEDQPVVQLMRLARVTAAQAYFGMGRPFGDINELLDLGLPERPWDQTGFLPMGLIPAAQLAAGVELTPPDGETPPEADTDELGQNSLADGGLRIADLPGHGRVCDTVHHTRADQDSTIRNPSSAQPSEAELARLWTLAMRPVHAQATAFRAVLRRLFAAQQLKAVKALRAHYGAKSQSQIGKADASGLLRIVFDIGLENQRLKVTAQAFVQQTADAALRQTLAAAGLAGEKLQTAVQQGLSSPAVVNVIRRQAWRATTLTNSRTAAAVQQALEEGLAAGESVNQMADRLDEVFAGRRNMARVIAQNSLGQVHSRVRHEGGKLAGFTRKGWVHSRGPGERRPSHIQAEARYLAEPIPIDGYFQIGDASLRFPRDYEANSPEETVNCQCLEVGRFETQTPRQAVLAHTAALASDFRPQTPGAAPEGTGN